MIKGLQLSAKNIFFIKAAQNYLWGRVTFKENIIEKVGKGKQKDPFYMENENLVSM